MILDMNSNRQGLVGRRHGNVNKENINSWEGGWEGIGKEFY